MDDTFQSPLAQSSFYLRSDRRRRVALLDLQRALLRDILKLYTESLKKKLKKKKYIWTT